MIKHSFLTKLWSEPTFTKKDICDIYYIILYILGLMKTNVLKFVMIHC